MLYVIFTNCPFDDVNIIFVDDLECEVLHEAEMFYWGKLVCARRISMLIYVTSVSHIFDLHD